MAQFRATIQGQRGVASRLGSKTSGLEVTANGWKLGIRVSVRHNKETGQDIFAVYKTQGSGRNSGHEVLIAEIKEFGEKKIIVGSNSEICRTCHKETCDNCLHYLANI